MYIYIYIYIYIYTYIYIYIYIFSRQNLELFYRIKPHFIKLNRFLSYSQSHYKLKSISFKNKSRRMRHTVLSIFSKYNRRVSYTSSKNVK